MAIEECQQQGANVAAVGISIGHDNNALIADLLNREILVDAGSKRRNKGLDFVVIEHLVEARAFGVEDLATQRQNRLEMAITTLFSGATGRVTFYDVNFA